MSSPRSRSDSYATEGVDEVDADTAPCRALSGVRRLEIEKVAERASMRAAWRSSSVFGSGGSGPQAVLLSEERALSRRPALSLYGAMVFEVESAGPRRGGGSITFGGTGDVARLMGSSARREMEMAAWESHDASNPRPRVGCTAVFAKSSIREPRTPRQPRTSLSPLTQLGREPDGGMASDGGRAAVV